MQIDIRGYDYEVQTETEASEYITEGLEYPERVIVCGIFRPNSDRNLLDLMLENEETKRIVSIFESKLN